MTSLSNRKMPSLKAVGLLVASCVVDSAEASFFDGLFGAGVEQKDQQFGHPHHNSYEELRDDEMINLLDEQAGDPRQIVTLNGGTTAFNATLNLTGHILLGLGIAAGLMFCLFLAALDDVGGNSGGYGYSGYGRSFNGDQGKSYYKRSTIDDDSKEMDQILISFVGPLLERMESNLEAKGTNGHCAVRLSCEANHPGVLSLENGTNQNGTTMTTTVTMGESLQRMFNLLERSQTLDFTDPRSKVHFEAMTAGRKGANCEELYPNCQRPTLDLIQTLKSY